MLSFFGLKPQCPVSLEDRVWIERKMGWLKDQLGESKLRAACLRFPEANDLPELRNLNSETVQSLFHRLAGVMDVRQKVALEIVPDEEIPHSAGLYEEVDGTGLIRITETTLADGPRTVAVLTHELAHAILLGEDLVDSSQADLEPLTNLATVFFGFGVFGANACLYEQYEVQTISRQWSISRVGYLSPQQIGYALAVFSWMRTDSVDELRGRLRVDANDAFVRGMKFLNYSDSHVILSRSDAFGERTRRWETRFESRSDALRFDVLCEMQEDTSPIPDRFLPALRDSIQHKESCIVRTGLEVLANQPHLAGQLQDEILNCLSQKPIRVKRAALLAIRAVPRTPVIVQALADVMAQQKDHGVRVAATKLLMGHTESLDGDNFVHKVLIDVRIALLNHDEETITSLLQVIDQLVDDAEAVIRERFEHTEDDDWLMIALSCFETARQRNADPDQSAEPAGWQS